MHHFDDPHAFATRLDAPERDTWQKPQDIINSLRLADDAVVAELGSGTGYFVVRLARHLHHGKVIGLDAAPKMVAYLAQRAADLGLTNVDARLVRADDALPLTEPVDLLLCVDTYHHLSNRVALFSAYRSHLKVGGKLLIIDRPFTAPEGPPAGHRLAPEIVKEELRNAGFTAVLDLDFLLPYQYYLVFKRTDDAAR